MKKIINGRINQHLLLTGICTLTIAILQLANNFRISENLRILDALKIGLITLVTLSILSLPLLYSVYLTYKYLDKNRIIKTIQIVVIPLIGAVAVPAILIYKAGVEDDRWLQFGAIMLISVNAVLYLANEVLLFLNLKAK